MLDMCLEAARIQKTQPITLFGSSYKNRRENRCFLNHISAVLFQVSILEQNVLQSKYANFLYFDYEGIQGKLGEV